MCKFSCKNDICYCMLYFNNNNANIVQKSKWILSLDSGLAVPSALLMSVNIYDHMFIYICSSTVRISIHFTKFFYILASILTLAAPIGCVLCGYLADTIGRRKVLALTKLPLALGWLFTGFARNPIQIILG